MKKAIIISLSIFFLIIGTKIVNSDEEYNLCSDVSSYKQFIKNNKKHSKHFTKEELDNQFDEAAAYIDAHPEGKTAEHLKRKITKKLNIRFLLKNIDRKELNVEIISVHKHKKYNEKELLFKNTEVGDISVLLLIPKRNGPWPAIVGLHGHGDSKKIFKNNYFGKDLVKKGFVVIMPDLRAMCCNKPEETISERLLSNGFTLMGLRIYETHLLIEYLKSRNFVNKKIGIIGHSGGSELINLVVRISNDIKAGISDFESDMLDLCWDRKDCIPPSPNCRTHCQTIPALSYYMPQINDSATLKIPFLKFNYKYPESDDKQEVLNFFEENLK